jgi:hypothetical protein
MWDQKGAFMLWTILIVILILVLIGGLPSWPHGGFGMGYSLSGVVGVILVILVIMLLLGRL